MDGCVSSAAYNAQTLRPTIWITQPIKAYDQNPTGSRERTSGQVDYEGAGQAALIWQMGL